MERPPSRTSRPESRLSEYKSFGSSQVDPDEDPNPEEHQEEGSPIQEDLPERPPSPPKQPPSPMSSIGADKPKEINLNRPEPYNGNPEKYKQFLNAIKLYLLVNDTIYNTDDRKIAFVLSFLTKGSAEQWQNNFIEKSLLTALGTYTSFLTEFEKSFKQTYAKESALEQLKVLRQGNKGIDDHNINFKGLVKLAGIKEEAINVISMYQDSLHPALLTKILSTEDVSTLTIDDWYSKAALHEKNWIRMKAILNRNKGTGFVGSKNTNANYMPNWRNYHANTRQGFTPRKDPNAMDVDSISVQAMQMSPEKLKDLKARACFYCHKLGHMAQECPKKGTRPFYPRPNGQSPTKKTGKEAAMAIHTLMAEIDDNNLDEFYQDMEENMPEGPAKDFS